VESDIKEDAELLRNREIRIYILLLGLVMLISTSVIFSMDKTAAAANFAALASVIVISVLFTKWRYGKIAELSRYLRRISSGEYLLDIRDNKEGELSILKNEIYKVTIMLAEQANMLKNDKRFLADSISDISHQLKTPITSMFVMTDLIQDENLPVDKRVEFTQNIKSQLERLQWLVTSLLKLSKIDAGTITFKKEKVNVKDLVNKSVEHLLIPIELKNQALEIIGDENAVFTGDFNWTSEAVANIVKNSMEHTPEGGKITISFNETSIYTMITISDNGEGIHKEDLPYIFNRFYKGKNAHDNSIGIGLAMSKSIIESQGGSINASSSAEGTQFTIKFYKSVV
jgi:signal transduction histidine kinase